jgi:hypothetical protein
MVNEQQQKQWNFPLKVVKIIFHIQFKKNRTLIVLALSWLFKEVGAGL